MRITLVWVVAAVMALAGSVTAVAQEGEQRPRLNKGAAVMAVGILTERGEMSEVALQRALLTHALTLSSPSHIRAVVGKGGGPIRRTRWFGETGDAAERTRWLMDRVKVEVVPGTAMIQVELFGFTDESERATILEELVNSYLEGLKSQRTSELLDRTAQLNNLRIVEERALKELVNDIRDREMQINGSGGGRGAAKLKMLEFLTRELTAAEVELARRANAKHDAESAVRKGEKPAGVEEVVLSDRRIVRMRDQLDDAETALAGLGEKDAAEGRKRVDVLRNRMEELKAELRTGATARTLSDLHQAVESQLAVVGSMLKRVDQLKADIGEMCGAELALEAKIQEAARVRSRILRLREEIDSIMSRPADLLVGVRWHIHPE